MSADFYAMLTPVFWPLTCRFASTSQGLRSLVFSMRYSWFFKSDCLVAVAARQSCPDDCRHMWEWNRLTLEASSQRLSYHCGWYLLASACTLARPQGREITTAEGLRFGP